MKGSEITMNKIILKYVIRKKLYRSLFVVPISIAIILGIILSLISGNMMNIIAVVILVLLVVISMITTEYDILNRTDYVPTPLNILDRKYSEIVERHDEIEFLGINPKEVLALKGIIREYEEAIDLLRTEEPLNLSEK